jgi:predicted lactoylglutathione lyase
MRMIGYCLVGVDDLERAAEFYDRIFEVIAVRRALTIPGRMVTWGAMWKEPHFAVALPFNKQAANVGNGSMVAIRAERRDLVDALHAEALAHGGADEGAPGLRGPDPDGFYGAYFRDLDGNKLCVFRYGPSEVG